MAGNSKHIQERSVIEHLAKARQKGYLASVELHNYGFSSKLFSFIDAFRDGLILFSLMLLTFPNMLWPIVLGFTLWRGLKMTLQGFMRLERLHFLVREEKYEIDHHRDEEREELMAIYATKGFKGAILEEVVATLMADDNRLLQVMLEEELGVSFEMLDHPVVSGLIASLGMLSAAFALIGLSHLPYGIIYGSLFLIMLAAFYEVKKQKLPSLSPLIWNLAALVFVFMCAHFMAQMTWSFKNA